MRSRFPFLLGWMRLVLPNASCRVCRDCRRRHLRLHDPVPNAYR
jgi:hypothetical protein